MSVLTQISQLILGLSILVILHEGGHFIFAKIFKTRVEKFYLFFNPWFSIFKFKKGETEYGLGWLPLGGYVKISGMIDESMDKEAMKQEPKPWEFRSKPAHQRLLIMIGGVLVNLLLGIFLYWMVLFVWGETKLPVANMEDGVWVVNPLTEDLGIQTGDKIVSIDGNEDLYLSQMNSAIAYSEEKTIIINRDGKEMTIDIPENFLEQMIDSKSSSALFMWRIPFIISNIPDTSHNAFSGLKTHDRVIGIDSVDIEYWDEFEDAAKGFVGKKVMLKVERENQIKEIEVEIDDSAKVGVVPAWFSVDDLVRLKTYEFEIKKYGFFESIPAGFNMAIDKLTNYVKGLGLLFKPETGALKGLGGFGTIMKLYDTSWNWHVFWEMTAFLSLILAFMNILPIPALDGGHVLFLLVEMVTGKKPSDKFLEYAQLVGMVILIGLLVVANGNDILRACS